MEGLITNLDYSGDTVTITIESKLNSSVEYRKLARMPDAGRESKEKVLDDIKKEILNYKLGAIEFYYIEQLEK